MCRFRTRAPGDPSDGDELTLICTYPRPQDYQTGLAVRLHRRLDGVYRREDHAEAGGGETGEDGLHEHREAFQKTVRLHQSKDARVRGGVAEARDGALDERGGKTLVVPCPAAVAVQRADRRGRTGSVPILIVHDGAQGHECQDLQDHG